MAQTEKGLFELQYNSAQVDFENGNKEVALNKVNEIIRLNSTYIDAYYLRGRIYFDDLKYKEALSDFNYLIGKMPKGSPDIYVERGLVHAAMKNYGLAIEDYTQAIIIKDDHILAYIQRGYCYFEIDEYNKSKNDLDNALLIDPYNSYALYIRGYLHVYGLANDQLAINDFTRLLDVDASYYDAYYDRGNAYLNLQLDDKACADFEIAASNGIQDAIGLMDEFCK